ncbi:PolC-type DNA polymerase III [Anaerococcus sp. NML200574]|uniref:PolC-type DNA polymerase III n=1 Tax=Anaerococcus sp. NML200574 TaxID=2954486 RepID=UPI002238F775|nr:PolC-type DNA polymerase III [Anaerococcus sp. NML200574]MCW6678750.1 PolC-type DNA polymerase III [Anaerococcus sp. NML200574]
MRIDLGSLIKVEKEIFYIIEATYYKKENRLHLLIESEDPLLSNKEEDLREYFSDMDLSISYKKIEIEEPHELENINEDLPENLGDNYDSFADDFEEEIDYMDIPPDEDLKPSKDDVTSDDFQNIDRGPEKVENEPCKSNKEESFSQEEKTETEEIPQKEENPNEQDSAEDLKKAKEAKLQRQIANAISIQNSAKEKIQNQKPAEDGLNFGRKQKLDPINIEDLYDKKGMANGLIGRIFGLSCFETKNGYFIYTFDLEDKTDAISCKIFANKNNNYKLEGLKDGMAVQVEGTLNFDDFAKEDVFTINSVREALIGKKVDLAADKRFELQLHTKYTNLDGFVDDGDLLGTLTDWGWDTIGITDTENLQVLPNIYDKYKSKGIKVLPGAELLMVEDDLRILTNLSEKDPADFKKLEEGSFVVFDIETTGLLRYRDAITEIGAVRVENGEITETYNQLINPERMLPEKIIEITGITDAMLADKPKIDEVLPGFLEFCGDAILVGQNTDFDVGFIRVNAQRLGLKFDPVYLDTLPMARALFDDMGKFSLDKIARKLEIPAFNHHRASDDARATAQIFIKMFEMITKEEGISLLNINSLTTNYPKAKHKTYSVLAYAKDKIGLKNLYQLISESRMNHIANGEARTPLSTILKYREGLILGSGGSEGILVDYLINQRSDRDIEKYLGLFDFYQVEPLSIYEDMIESGKIDTKDQVRSINEKIIAYGNRDKKLVAATGGVRYLNPRDYKLRNILKKGSFFFYKENRPLYYLRTTDEMLREFAYLGDKISYDLVIANPKKIADQIEDLRPIPPGTFPPKIEGSEEMLRETCFRKAHSIYGDKLPEIVEARLEKELNSIISNGYAVLYIIAQKLVKKSNDDGYLVGSRGSVGSSFAATMADITEVNPLCPHYVCPNCKHSEFFPEDLLGSGIDYPDKACPECGAEMKKDGHNIPFEVFLGFEGDKEPDIDLNFAGEYQPTIHKYTEELFGRGHVFRAGTIGKIQDNTAFGYIKKYMEENNLNLTNAQIRSFQRGLKDVKRSTGQHPGGLIVVPNDIDVFDITPIQYPADDPRGDIRTTHFPYSVMEETLLKLDLLGHDVPSIIRALQDLTDTDPLNIKMDDSNVMKIFSSTEPLKIKHDFSNNDIGTLGIPEFGTNFVRGMLKDTYPKKFSEMARISGLSHGTDVWLNNAQDLVKSNTASFDEIISTRDDIMNALITEGLDKKKSFQIMERVRKGKGLDDETIAYMKENGVKDWYVESCLKIKYLFPKAHAVAYCLMSYRIAYYKVYYPEAFYASYFNSKLNDFSYSTILSGFDAVRLALDSYKDRFDLTQRDNAIKTVLEVAEEMHAREIKIKKADIYKSDARKFLIEDGAILPPLAAVDDVSEAMAKDIVEEREKGNFISIEDLRSRTCLNKNAIKSLKDLGIIDGIQEENQMSLFDGLF